MRKINLSTLYAGPRGCWGPGICDVPDDIAQELVENNLAIPVRVEKRDAAESEDAVAAEEVPSASSRRRRTAVKAADDAVAAEEESKG